MVVQVTPVLPGLFRVAAKVVKSPSVLGPDRYEVAVTLYALMLTAATPSASAAVPLTVIVRLVKSCWAAIGFVIVTVGGTACTS